MMLEKIYLNGGKRGFLVGLAPAEVQRLLRPQLVTVGIRGSRLLKNSHLAAVLESHLVRRSAVYALQGATPPRDFLRVRRSDYF